MEMLSGEGLSVQERADAGIDQREEILQRIEPGLQHCGALGLCSAATGFRCNLFRDRKGVGGVFRLIPSKIMTTEDLGLSEAILRLCYLSKGLVLVTGPTGSHQGQPSPNRHRRTEGNSGP